LHFNSRANCLIIGEVAQTHDGSLGLAHAFIDAIAKSGADAVKFQTHIAAEESTAAEPWRIKFSKQDESRFDYWQRMEFSDTQWSDLKRHAEECGLLFLSSPFSAGAVDMLDRIGIEAWKIASGELFNPFVLDPILATGKPVIASSGMSDWRELDALVERFRQASTTFALLQCSSVYPCPPEHVGLNVIEEIRQHYHCPTGLSDHSGTIYPSLAAATLGASVLEVHVTLSRDMFGPDVPASVTTDELTTLVEGVRYIECMRDHPIDKNAMGKDLEPTRAIFGKSLVARTALRAGTIVRTEDIGAKKPGTGIPAKDAGKIIGRTLNKDVGSDHFFTESDFT